jgi:hypothetical protein
MGVYRRRRKRLTKRPRDKAKPEARVSEDRVNQGNVRAPISAHPAFPLLVGLWFAALLGLGTVVMPSAVLEQFASATGLSGVFPQAQAPITASARAAFALLATIIGAVGGLALARRVAASQEHAVRAPRRRAPRTGNHAETRAVRPLSVHDDLGEGIATPADDQPMPIPGRRRALAVLEEERPSDFLLAAPLPGHEDTAPPELPIDEEPMTERPSEFDAPLPVEAEEELDLSRLVADSPIYDSPAPEPVEHAPADQPPADAQVFAAPAEPVAEEIAPPAYVPELDTRKPRDIVAPPASEVADEPAAVVAQEITAPLAAAPVTEAPLDATLEDLGMVQLAERLGRSLQQRLATAALSPEAEIEPTAEPLTFSAPSFEQEPEDAAVAVPPPVVPDALRAFMDETPEAAAPDETIEEETGELQVPVPVVPPALRPFAFEPFDSDDDDDDDTLDAGSFTLPLANLVPRPFDAPKVVASMDIAPIQTEASAESEEDEDDALAESDESYSSLLEMNNPFRAREEFVRVDEPEAEDEDVEPAVVFPGQEAPVGEAAAPANAGRPFDAPTQSGNQPAPSTAPARPRAVADPAETDRALRSALANLQRMSGAA